MLRHSSPIIHRQQHAKLLIINWKILSLACCQNSSEFPYQNFDNTQVKLFPNFTRHHSITNKNLSVSDCDS